MRLRGLEQYTKLQGLQKFAAEKTAAKFRAAMQGLMNRNPAAFNKYLKSQGVPEITPGNYSDTSFFTAMQQLKQNRGAVPSVRPHNPAPGQEKRFYKTQAI